MAIGAANTCGTAGELAARRTYTGRPTERTALLVGLERTGVTAPGVCDSERERERERARKERKRERRRERERESARGRDE